MSSSLAESIEKCKEVSQNPRLLFFQLKPEFHPVVIVHNAELLVHSLHNSLDN